MKRKDYIALPVRNRRRMFEKATKLWEILEIALFELYLVERNPKFTVYMGVWYQPVTEVWNHSKSMWEQKKVCEVCLAGSVMAGCYPTYTSKKGGGITPYDFHEFNKATSKMQALDLLRQGKVGDAAWSYMCLGKYKYLNMDRYVRGYEGNKKYWWKDMRKLLKDLKKANV